MNDCMNCSYCQKCYYRNEAGIYTESYYGCHFPPHWGKDTRTICKCPREFSQKDLDAVAAKLNGR